MISVPHIGPDLAKACAILGKYNFSLRLIMLILVDGALAYGFGGVFVLISKIQDDTFDPTVILLNIVTVTVSAWVTLFNVDLFIASSSSSIVNRGIMLSLFGLGMAILNITLLVSHLEKYGSYDNVGRFRVAIMQSFLFLFMGIVVLVNL